MEKGKIVICMSSMGRTSFDFVGRIADFTNEYIKLVDALALVYNDMRRLESLAPLHLPLGSVDVMSGSALYLPREGIAYIVELPKEGEDWIHSEYQKFWKENAAVESVKTAE